MMILMVADAGSSFPGSDRLRTYIDRCGASVFRPVYDSATIKAAAVSIRAGLLQELLRRRDKLGWIHRDADVGQPEDLDPWSEAQAMAAILRDVQDVAPQSFHDLGLLFEGARAVEKDGVFYGWLQGPEAGYTIAQPSLWIAIALAEALRVVPVKDEKTRQELQSWLDYTHRTLTTYRPEGSVGWNMFPRQRNSSQHCTYTSTLALWMLLDLRVAGASLAKNAYEFDYEIRMLATWIQEGFQDSEDSSGWRATATDPVSDGLTLQVYATLLRAEAEVNIKLRDKIVARIPWSLRSLVNRRADYPNGLAHYFVIFTDHREETSLRKKEIGFLWYPWAVECAWRWLRRLEHFHAPRDEVVSARRALGNLVVREGKTAVDGAVGTYTFQVSEVLFAVSGLLANSSE